MVMLPLFFFLATANGAIGDTVDICRGVCLPASSLVYMKISPVSDSRIVYSKEEKKNEKCQIDSRMFVKYLNDSVPIIKTPDMGYFYGRVFNVEWDGGGVVIISDGNVIFDGSHHYKLPGRVGDKLMEIGFHANEDCFSVPDHIEGTMG